MSEVPYGTSLFLQQAVEEEDTKGKGTAATVPFPFDIAIKLNIKHNADTQQINLNFFIIKTNPSSPHFTSAKLKKKETDTSTSYTITVQKLEHNKHIDNVSRETLNKASS